MTAKSTASPPKPSIWRKSPDLTGMGVLLNQITEAALILDRSRSSVLSVNPPFLALTANSAENVTNCSFSALFHEPSDLFITADGEKIAKILRKHRTPLDVRLTISPIDSSGRWALATFQQIQRELQSNWQEALLNGLMELARLASKGDLQHALEQAVQILHEILGLDMIGIYQADSDYPQLRLISAFDPNLILPETLPVNDLIRLSTSQLWFPGRRVSTDLYRNGRLKGVSYLASTPLGQEGAWLGLLVVGDRQAQPIANLMQYVSVMGAMLSTAIEHFILVTNQQLVIEKQRRSLALQNVLSEHVREGVVLVKPDLTIESINPVAEVMLGYTEQDVRHEPVENILIGSERLLPAINEAQRGVVTNDLGNTMLHRRDGHAFPAMIQTIPIEMDGVVQATLVLITDISTDEQNKVRTRQLEQRAVIGEVIQVFAHEVRNPINNLSLALEDMTNQFEGNTSVLDTVSRMQGDCFRLSHLMESILSSSRPEPRFERIELPMLLRKIIERWRPRLSKVGVVPFSELDPKTPSIRGDARSLEQVFTNLISNAMDAMAKQGGGTISIKSAAYNVIPNLPQVEVTITDNGPGIPDEIREHIFEPFVSNNPRGTGLGLAITKQIVTTHRGSIQVNTFPGGTVFQVVLPALINGEE
jgi:two-component system, NtrC family, sensor histidine kinase AtoS